MSGASQQAVIVDRVGQLVKSFWEEFEEPFFQKGFLKVLKGLSNGKVTNIFFFFY